MTAFLLQYGWLIWLLGLLLGPLASGMVLNGRNGDVEEQRTEYDKDRRRVAGGTIWRDVIWDMKGDEERSVQRLTEILACSDMSQVRAFLAQEIQTRFRQQERLNRLLHFRDQGDD